MQSLMGIVHETGHARYEQGLPKELAGTPAGEARSMGIHESQSLFFEMQIGRNNAFIDHLARLAQIISLATSSRRTIQRRYTRE